jgi:hypothetical protein
VTLTTTSRVTLSGASRDAVGGVTVMLLGASRVTLFVPTMNLGMNQMNLIHEPRSFGLFLEI